MSKRRPLVTDGVDEERDRMIAALRAAGRNRTKAIKMLKMSRPTFYRRLKEYGLVAR